MDTPEKIWSTITSTVSPVTSQVSSTVFDASRGAVTASRKVDEEGTPVRSGIKGAREAINSTVASMLSARSDATARVDGLVSLARDRLSPLEPWAAHADELRKSRPELLVACVAAPVVLLTAIAGRGKLGVLRNGLFCGLAASAAVACSKLYERR